MTHPLWSRSLLHRLLCGALVAVVMGLAWSCPAGAHNALASAEPPDGSTVGRDGVVTLTFASAVPLDTMSVDALSESGSRTELSGLAHGQTDLEVQVPLSGLAPGSVTLRWRLVGPDGHVVTDRLRYTLDDAPGVAPAVPTASVDAVSVALPAEESRAGSVGRWAVRLFGYVAMLSVVGVVATARLVRPGGTPLSSLSRLPSFGLATVAVLALVQLLQLAGQIREVPAWAAVGELGVALDTTAGQALAVRCVVAGAAALALSFGGNRAARQASGPVGLAVGVALLSTWSMAGHARSMRWPVLGVPLDIAHQAAAAVWLGGIAVVALELRRLEPSEAQVVVERFSTVARWAVLVLVATGLVTTLRFVDSVSAIFDLHGAVLAAKLSVVAAMLWIADVNRRRVVRWAGRGVPPRKAHVMALRRAMVTELVSGLLVVSITAALVAATPTTGS